MKKSILKYLLAFLVLASTLPNIASAQTITGMVANVANVIMVVGGFIVVIMWFITGYLFLAAQGDPGKLKTARTALFTSIAGTAIMILATVAVNIIGSVIFNGV